MLSINWEKGVAFNSSINKVEMKAFVTPQMLVDAVQEFVSFPCFMYSPKGIVSLNKRYAYFVVCYKVPEGCLSYHDVDLEVEHMNDRLF